MSNTEKTRVFQVNFKRSYLSLFNKPELIAAYSFGSILIGLFFIAETSFSNALLCAVIFSALSYYLLTPDEYGGEIKLLSLRRLLQRISRESKFKKEVQLEIWDNAVFQHNKVSVVLEVKGVNIRALGQDERVSYYEQIGKAVNALQIEDLQVIVRKERAQITDFIDHIRFVEHALGEHSGHKEEHAAKYVKNIANMLDSYWIHNTKTYLLISSPLDKKASPEQQIKTLSQLANDAESLLRDLHDMGIKTRQLLTEELAVFVSSFIK